MPRSSLTTRPAAFTLIELLVVIAIIGILAGLIFSALGKVKDKIQVATCMSHLRQVGIAMQGYLNDHEMTYPVARLNNEANKPYWRAIIAPYIVKNAGEIGTNISTKSAEYKVFWCPGMLQALNGVPPSTAPRGDGSYSINWYIGLTDQTQTNPGGPRPPVRASAIGNREPLLIDGYFESPKTNPQFGAGYSLRKAELGVPFGMAPWHEGQVPVLFRDGTARVLGPREIEDLKAALEDKNDFQ